MTVIFQYLELIHVHKYAARRQGNSFAGALEKARGWQARKRQKVDAMATKAAFSGPLNFNNVPEQFLVLLLRTKM